ncbi:MAG: carbamoyltransferase C-terminal domain-containing protein, partial [Streptosporangiaceae bacterium]
ALSNRLDYFRRELKVENLCISGGFALNVVVNGHMLTKFPGGVYVPSAPGDDGQCLGNVYVMLAEQKEEIEIMPTITKSSDAFLGTPNAVDPGAVAQALADSDHKSYIVFETTDVSDLIAQMLASGSVVCLYQPRAEFGPRALGARSILADPRRADAVSRLNILKGREWFMPFAPTVLREAMSDWFVLEADSPFMSFAVKATPRAVRELPAIVNADKSARVQTVDSDDRSPLRGVLIRFAEHTQVPVLLNTSFNQGGEPIVETVQQAIDSFSSMPVNALGIGRFVVIKSLSPDAGDLPISTTISHLDLEVYSKYRVASIRRVPRVAKRRQESYDNSTAQRRDRSTVQLSSSAL